MKRKIKFRGRCAGSWRKGDHLTYTNGEVIKQWNGGFSFEYTVEPETVGQFTGEYDMNGVEIYEGDIVEFGNKHKFIIKWDDKEVGFSMFNLDGIKSLVQFYGEAYKKLKVVGNIFDNPEFLKGGEFIENQH